MKIQAPFWAESKELKHLFCLLDDQVRFVGGCVRDTLLGATPNDTDLATPLLPAEVKERLEPHFRIIPTGIEHGTLTVLINGKDLKKPKSRRCAKISPPTDAMRLSLFQKTGRKTLPVAI